MPFKPGESGNPAGQKKGATWRRRALARNFIRNVHEAWKANGIAVLERLAKENPAAFAKIAADLIPKDVNVAGSVTHEHSHVVRQVSETAAWLEGLVGAGAESPSKELVPH